MDPAAYPPPPPPPPPAPLPPTVPQPPVSGPPRPVISNEVVYHMGPRSLRSRFIRIGLVLAAVGLFIAGAVLLAGWLRGPGKYGQLQTVTVTSTTASTDGAYTMQIPKEFSALQREADSSLYVHTQSKDPNSPVLARVSATAIYVGEENMENLRTELTAQVAAKSGAVYDGFVRDQVRYIVSAAGGDVTIDDMTESVDDLQQDNLSGPFQYRSDQGDDATGRIKVVFGTKHLYILTAMAPTDRWQDNTNTWNTVFASFDVDTSQVGS